jgi:hypothetical protein
VGGNVYVRWGVGRQPIPRSRFQDPDERKRERKTDREKPPRIDRQILAALEEGSGRRRSGYTREEARALFRNLPGGAPAAPCGDGSGGASSRARIQELLEVLGGRKTAPEPVPASNAAYLTCTGRELGNGSATKPFFECASGWADVRRRISTVYANGLTSK